MTTHSLKINKLHYLEVKLGRKTAELRVNDRDYKIGDTLILNVDEIGSEPVYRQISHILQGGHYGLADEYVMLSMKYI